MRKFVQIREQSRELKVGTRKIPVVVVYPTYSASGKDFMKKGGMFYAILNHETGMWSKRECDVVNFIDRELREYTKKHYIQTADGTYKNEDGMSIYVEYLDDSSTNRLKEFNIWSSNLPADHNYIQLDTEITFRDQEVTPEMYRSIRLGYDIGKGDCEAYEKLMSTLYSEEDRKKIEWLVGSIFAGESKDVEKMLVLYGAPGSGKSTVLDLIKKLVKGYWVAFVAGEVASKQHQFSTAAFKDNPLVAIQDDGSLAKIDSPVINEIVSHKDVVINEKRKSQYTIRSNAVLFLATNDTVDLHDTQLGITRRLLDVYPSGKTLPVEEYEDLVSRLNFELGAIAYHCRELYLRYGKNYYVKYSPEVMIQKTNYLRNFLFDNLELVTSSEYVTRDKLYNEYKNYCEDCGLGYPPIKLKFGEQIKEYFENYDSRKYIDGRSLYHVYSGFKVHKVLGMNSKDSEKKKTDGWLNFDCTESLFDKLYSEQPAQYANEEGTPINRWTKVKTKLKDIDTHKLHWMKLPAQVVKVDFDKKDKDGNKSLEENLKEANKFAKTYAEVSKSGCGIHLYYIYDGDVSKLSRIFDENIEVKVSTGDNSHRRILTKCNNIPIATINSGLPLKEEKPKIDDFTPTEHTLRVTIKRCIAKEIHADTTSNVDWIYEILERAYNAGIVYDVSDMYEEVKSFAEHSTNQSERCLKKVSMMHFKSDAKDDSLKGGMSMVDVPVVEFDKELRNYILRQLKNEDKKAAFDNIEKTLNSIDTSEMIYDVSDMYQSMLISAVNSNDPETAEYCINLLKNLKLCSEKEGNYDSTGYRDEDPIIFFDWEVKPNMNLLCWKVEGKNNPVIKWFNPTPEQIEEFVGMGKKHKNKIIGFNNKEYDNHITYAVWLGKSPYEVFCISQGIINKEKNAKYREAKKMSYSDILDFCPNKMSLKKWEIKLKIPHKEFNQPWDKPIDEEFWPALAEYCVNDVLATEEVFKANQPAWKGRQILVDLVNIIVGPGSTVNDSTNELTTRLIVGDDKNPQRFFNYPDLSKEFPGYEFDPKGIDKSRYISKDVIISGKSFYKGYDPGEGGFVWANHGMYGYSVSFDSASHHPSSIVAENGFGKYTENFKMLLQLRLMVKHKEYDKLRSLYNGALAKYLENEEDAKALSFALKIAINSVYGLTAAKFKNKLRDDRNIDNWVAKRGALFMIDLMLNVQNLGYTVLHCKTDSIKVLNPDEKIRNYISEYGKKFGYTFEIEHEFDRLCLVNDAVYVCKYTNDPINEDLAGKWDATGKQFQVPYVFKTLFSHEDIEFDDMCETKNTSTALYLDFNEKLSDGEHDYRFIGKTGEFCPVKEGIGGGILYRDNGNGGYAAAEGTKGYRWLESEVVKELHKENYIDTSYYRKQVDKAIETINKYGDFEAFVSDGPYYDFMNVPETEEVELPFL